MMISDSRASTSLKDNLKSTRGSLFYKAMGRDTKPAWGNRIVKDFYDLDYNPESDLLSNSFKKSSMNKSRPYLQTRRQKHNHKKAAPADQLPPPSTLPTRKNYSLSLRNPERIEISFKEESTASKHLGLSPY